MRQPNSIHLFQRLQYGVYIVAAPIYGGQNCAKTMILAETCLAPGLHLPCMILAEALLREIHPHIWTRRFSAEVDFGSLAIPHQIQEPSHGLHEFSRIFAFIALR